MAYSLNRAQIIGNMTRDPDMRNTPAGQTVCSFGVATNRRWKSKDTGEQKEEVQFHNIVAWGKLAEICQQILHKGNKVYIEGRLQTRNWEGQDGAKRERTEIVMDNFVALTPKGAPVETAESAEEAPAPQKEPEVASSATRRGGEKKSDKKPLSAPKGATGGKEDLEEVNLDDIPF